VIAIATAALFVTIGFAVALAIPEALPRFVAGRVAAIVLLGAGACGAGLFAAGVAGIAVCRPTVVALWVVALAAALFAWRASRRLVRATRIRGDVHEILSTMVIVAPFALLTWTTGILPLADYDGRTTWIAKANAIAHDGSIDGPFFRGEQGLNLHNRYPLLMPLDASAAMLLAGRDDAYRALYVFLPAALLLAVRDLLSRSHGTAATSWCVAAAAWLPQIVVAPEGGASSAYSDLALAAFAGMAVATLAARGRRASFAAGLWAAFAILTKNEGAMLAIALFIALCLSRPGWRATARFLAAPAAALALLGIWRRSIPEAYDERNAALIAELPGRIGRLDDALVAMVRHAFDWNLWGAFWLVVLVACAVVPIATRRRIAVVPLTALVLALGAYVAALACTSWSIDELARVAANRLLVHCLVPALAVVVALASAIRGRGESGGELDRPSGTSGFQA
jgi:hypothetical protein